VSVTVPDDTTLIGSAVRLDPDGGSSSPATVWRRIVGAGDVVHVR
jgi:BirA family biotin operon repressor/biotin-[acetyl-CoA-carboxylase] ligase